LGARLVATGESTSKAVTRALIFTDLLRWHRRAAGFSQEGLAELAGINRSGIS
jgi:hypothetical protein